MALPPRRCSSAAHHRPPQQPRPTPPLRSCSYLAALRLTPLADGGALHLDAKRVAQLAARRDGARVVHVLYEAASRAFPEAALTTLRITAKGLAFEAGEALGVGAAEGDDAVVVLWTDGGGVPRASVAGSEAAEATATAWLRAEPWAQLLWEQSARRKLAGLGTFDY
eukprot:SM002695S09727  [mRNA]  locus=s2695:80:946:+ [translate_table: standard]